MVHLKPASTSSLRVQCTMPVGCSHWKCGCLDRSSDSQHSRRRVYFRCASLLWFCTWGRGSRHIWQLAHLVSALRPHQYRQYNKAITKKLAHHLWYLSEELVGLAFIDSEVPVTIAYCDLHQWTEWTTHRGAAASSLSHSHAMSMRPLPSSGLDVGHPSRQRCRQRGTTALKWPLMHNWDHPINV